MDGINALTIALFFIAWLGLGIISAGAISIATMRSSQISQRRGE
jgi:hypothetical protein